MPAITVYGGVGFPGEKDREKAVDRFSEYGGGDRSSGQRYYPCRRERKISVVAKRKIVGESPLCLSGRDVEEWKVWLSDGPADRRCPFGM